MINQFLSSKIKKYFFIQTNTGHDLQITQSF